MVDVLNLTSAGEYDVGYDGVRTRIATAQMANSFPHWGGAERVALLTSIRKFSSLPPAVRVRVAQRFSPRRLQQPDVEIGGQDGEQAPPGKLRVARIECAHPTPQGVAAPPGNNTGKAGHATPPPSRSCAR